MIKMWTGQASDHRLVSSCTKVMKASLQMAHGVSLIVASKLSSHSFSRRSMDHLVAGIGLNLVTLSTINCSLINLAPAHKWRVTSPKPAQLSLFKKWIITCNIYTLIGTPGLPLQPPEFFFSIIHACLSSAIPKLESFSAIIFVYSRLSDNGLTSKRRTKISLSVINVRLS